MHQDQAAAQTVMRWLGSLQDTDESVTGVWERDYELYEGTKINIEGHESDDDGSEDGGVALPLNMGKPEPMKLLLRNGDLKPLHIPDAHNSSTQSQPPASPSAASTKCGNVQAYIPPAKRAENGTASKDASNEEVKTVQQPVRQPELPKSTPAFSKMLASTQKPKTAPKKGKKGDKPAKHTNCGFQKKERA